MRSAAHGAYVAILNLAGKGWWEHAMEPGVFTICASEMDKEYVRLTLAKVEARSGSARELMNRAGVAPAIERVLRGGAHYHIGESRKMIKVNLIKTFNMIAQFAARTANLTAVGKQRGLVINFASVAGYDGQIGQAVYSASKGGLVGLTLPIARELVKL